MYKRLWCVPCLFAFLLVGANTAKALELKVMTRNLYVGTDLEKPLSLSRSELPTAVAAAWVTFQNTNYVVRMAAIAEEICSVSPHLVGLQEVMLLRASTPAGEIFKADFLETLLRDLALLYESNECEHSYKEVAKVQNVDVEMPMATASGYVDIRLTDHEVILARDDVVTSNVDNGTYAAALHYKTATIPRGWVAVDAEIINGATVRFASTHLESVSTVRHAQGVELIRILARENRPLILLGDFNTPAPGDLTYQFFLGAGYTDWGPDPGDTCCQEGDLNNPDSQLDERIDIVFTRNIALAEGQSILIGDTPSEELKPFGIFWPSDHAGVVTTLEFEP
jgi:endonuclease/exonuclease/phosphatase family metal-dependent hydrolase